MSTPAFLSALKTVIETRPHRAYAPSGESSGPSEALFYKGTQIAGESEFTSCVAETWEVLFLTLVQFPAITERLSVAQMKHLFKRTYIIAGSPGFDDSWVSGVAGGLIEAGIADPVEWENAQPGDFAQIQWDASENPWHGHAVTIVSSPRPSPKGTGAPVLWAYSGNTSTPAFVAPEGVLARPPWADERHAGSQVDYFGKVKAGKDRRWHLARIKPELVS